MNIQESSTDWETEIKVEHVEDSLFNSELHVNNSNERETKGEYSDEPQFIIKEEIHIKDENQEVEQSTNMHGDTTTRKKKKKYFCNSCSYATERKGNFTRHMLIHTRKNGSILMYFCSQCSYKSSSDKRLSKHIETHSSCICNICKKYFKEKRDLDAHYLFKHPNESEKRKDNFTHKINECLKCDYKTVRSVDFKRHLALHGTPDKRPFACENCGKRFNRKVSLDGHIVSQHSNSDLLMNSLTSSVYCCDSCDYKSVARANLKRHLVVCFKKNQFLKHLSLHTGQLSFFCTECNKGFNRKIQLDGHIVRRHFTNKQLMSSVTYKVRHCDSCDYKTVSISNLKHHVRHTKHMHQ